MKPDPITAGPFAGMNNRLPETKLRNQEGPAFVRNAVNVDLTEAGSFARRQGVTPKLAGTDCHSFWSSGEVGFYVDGSTLYRVTGPAESPIKASIATVTPGLRMSFADTGSDVRASNGAQALRIAADGTVSEWSVPTPVLQPILAAGSGGSLAAGIYRAVISYTNANGEEGATTFPVSVTVPENGALSVMGIPQLAGMTTNLYLTPANGDTFYRAGQPSGSTFSVTLAPDNGVRPVGLLLAPMPAGQIVRMLNGRLLVASANMLFYSEPHQLGLYNPSRNYIPFPAPITMVEPCVAGIYLAADKTYWLAGDIATAALVTRLPYGAVAGTGGHAPNENRAWWMSDRGFVVGDQEGLVKNVQEKSVAVDPALVGASLFREQDGMKQMIASLFSPQSTVVAASSYMEAEIVRKETVL